MTDENTTNTVLQGNSDTTVEKIDATIQSASFVESLSDDLKSEASLQDFKDASGLAKSYLSAQKMVSSSVRIPGEDASAEAQKEFYDKLQAVPGVVKLPTEGNAEELDQLYNKLGRPQTAEDYRLNLPEGVNANPEEIADFTKIAHEAGLTNDQMSKVMGFEIERLQGQQEQSNEKIQAGEAALREMWGHDYSNRLAGASATAKMYSEKYPDAMQELINGDAGSNPAFLAILSELHKTVQEDGHVGTSAVKYGLTPDEAKIKIQEILSNPAHDYHSDDPKARKTAVETMETLHKAIYDGK